MLFNFKKLHLSKQTIYLYFWTLNFFTVLKTYHQLTAVIIKSMVWENVHK